MRDSPATYMEIDAWRADSAEAWAKVRELEAKLASVSKDARRYRWLCKKRTRGHILYLFGIVGTAPKKSLDAAIDAAIAAKE